MIKSVSYGFITGFCVGCIPNKLCMKFEHEHKNKNINLPIPLLLGLICSAGIIFSPLLVMNYFCDGVYFDKFIDRFIDKYDIKMQRFHQYDGKDNKYAFPSIIILNIKSNENNEDNEDNEDDQDEYEYNKDEYDGNDY